MVVCVFVSTTYMCAWCPQRPNKCAELPHINVPSTHSHTGQLSRAVLQFRLATGVTLNFQNDSEGLPGQLM